MVAIRSERAEDIPAIRTINIAAFTGKTEADLVDVLRDRGKLSLSLVAEEDNVLVGHIAFSKVTIDEWPSLRGAGLAPMAVVPGMQRKGIGSALVRAGLETCRSLGYSFVIVVGHAHYYPRFGFRPAKNYGIKCLWEVPDDVFMVLELQQRSLTGVHGLVRYEPEFNEV